MTHFTVTRVGSVLLVTLGLLLAGKLRLVCILSSVDVRESSAGIVPLSEGCGLHQPRLADEPPTHLHTNTCRPGFSISDLLVAQDLVAS